MKPTAQWYKYYCASKANSQPRVSLVINMKAHLLSIMTISTICSTGTVIWKRAIHTKWFPRYNTTNPVVLLYISPSLKSDPLVSFMKKGNPSHLIKCPLVLTANFLLFLRSEVILDIEQLPDLFWSLAFYHIGYSLAA